ncbi:MAG: hypothetical protein ACTTJ7_02520, partial [Treponema sp.]
GQGFEKSNKIFKATWQRMILTSLSSAWSLTVVRGQAVLYVMLFPAPALQKSESQVFLCIVTLARKLPFLHQGTLKCDVLNRMHGSTMQVSNRACDSDKIL